MAKLNTNIFDTMKSGKRLFWVGADYSSVHMIGALEHIIKFVVDNSKELHYTPYIYEIHSIPRKDIKKLTQLQLTNLLRSGSYIHQYFSASTIAKFEEKMGIAKEKPATRKRK